jgi:hypothetical protein
MQSYRWLRSSAGRVRLREGARGCIAGGCLQPTNNLVGEGCGCMQATGGVMQLEY